MRFFNERAETYAARGALIGAVAGAVSTLALFIAIDAMIAKNLQGEQSAGLVRVVVAMGGTICALCAVQIGFAGGALVGGATAASYDAGRHAYETLFGTNPDNPTHLNMV